MSLVETVWKYLSIVPTVRSSLDKNLCRTHLLWLPGLVSKFHRWSVVIGDERKVRQDLIFDLSSCFNSKYEVFVSCVS